MAKRIKGAERMIKFKKKNRISDDEYNQIIEEIAERIKDLLFGNGVLKSIKNQFSKRLIERTLNSDNGWKEITLKFTYNLLIIANDIKQILNRIRRNHE